MKAMTMLTRAAQPRATGVLQRSCGGHCGASGGGCADCNRKKQQHDTASTPRHDFGSVSVFGTRAPNEEEDSEFTTGDGGTGGPAPAQVGPAGGGAPAAGPTLRCEVASGPAYTPNGSIPVTISGGKKNFPFNFAATFTNHSPNAVLAGCCEVRQFIKWDAAIAAVMPGGVPHSGFPAGAAVNTWIEDRDTAGTRYGHRSGPFSAPQAAGRDEYTTNGVRDQLYGDTYNGFDRPSGPMSAVGNWYFRLDAIDTCKSDAVKASSSVITVHWG